MGMNKLLLRLRFHLLFQLLLLLVLGQLQQQHYHHSRHLDPYLYCL